MSATVNDERLSGDHLWSGYEMQNSICHSLWRGGYAQRRVIPVERHEFGIAVIPVALFQPVSLDKPRHTALILSFGPKALASDSVMVTMAPFEAA